MVPGMTRKQLLFRYRVFIIFGIIFTNFGIHSKKRFSKLLTALRSLFGYTLALKQVFSFRDSYKTTAERIEAGGR